MNPDDPLGLMTPQQPQADPNDPLGLMQAAPQTAPAPAQPTAAPPGPPENPNDISGAVARHVLNAAQGIPGMESLEAGAGMLGSRLTGNPLTYQQSLGTLRGETGKIGGFDSAIEKAAGGALTLPFLPANPVAAGAIYGAADQALSPDHPGALGPTALGALGGGLLGKGADMGVSLARGLLAQSPAANLAERALARAASAKRLYGAALAQGAGKSSPEIQAYLQEPDIAEIVGALQNTRAMKGVDPQSPEMLDAIYKTLSDRSATVRKGLLAVNPSKPNIGRFEARNIAAAQQAGLQAMDPTMPGYKGAVADFAQRKAAEDALSRGYDAVRTGLLKNLPASRNLLRTTPDAFKKWAATAGPDETQAAIQGILGATRKALGQAPLSMGRKAVGLAPGLLRASGDATASYLPRVGLLAAIGSH